jgi:magnesium transporter
MAAPHTHQRPTRTAVLSGRRASAVMRVLRGRAGNGAHPPVVPPQLDQGVGSAVVDWALYDDGKRRDDVTSYADAVARARHGGGFVWIGLFEPTEQQLAGVAEEFDLHPLAVEDAVTAEHQRPKLERYDDSLFAVFKTLRYCAQEKAATTGEVIETGEVMAFVGPAFVVTVRHGDHSGLGQVRRQLQDDPEHLARGPMAVLHGVADRVVDDYLAVVDQLQDDIDELEISVFSSRGARDVGRVYQLKRQVLELKRAVAPLAVPLRHLAEGRVRGVGMEMREYFRDVEDHLTRVREQVAGFDELLTSILQATLAQLAVAENEDMRRISAWVAIIAVPTMIAGIYGMNFDYMPELQTRYGYPVVMLVIVASCAILHRHFKRNGWL